MLNPLSPHRLALLFALPAIAAAQAPTPTALTPDLAEAAPAAYHSVLNDYRPYTDQQIMSWKKANDNVGRIGGWREYAKEARQPQAPDTAARPDPHAGSGKP